MTWTGLLQVSLLVVELFPSTRAQESASTALASLATLLCCSDTSSAKMLALARWYPGPLYMSYLIIYNLGMEIISQHIYVLFDKHSALSCQLNKLPFALRYLIIKAVSFLPKFALYVSLKF
jgi:hypothetical protein